MGGLRYLAIIGLLVGALFGNFLPPSAIAAATAPVPPTVVAPVTEEATVKVILDKSHGSGVHIGNGFVLTAAHVAGDAKSVQLKSKDGQMRQADVLWVNKTYDIALLRTSPAMLPAANLSCATAKVGEAITAYGNPMNVEFIRASGKIAGEPRETGPWKSVFVTDMTTVMGQSGGGVFGEDGRVVGITVGVMGANLGIFPTLVGFGFVVPSSDVCALLARTA